MKTSITIIVIGTLIGAACLLYGATLIHPGLAWMVAGIEIAALSRALGVLSI